MDTWQTETWLGQIGREYTNRNALSVDEAEQMYVNKFGITRTQMNEQFIGNLDKASKILEVGCNIGNQLLILQRRGFVNLYGIELQSYAVEIAKQRTHGINIIEGSAFDIPFRDNYFDIVFTSGVLIHFTLDDLDTVMKEIYRCTSKYIWGYEYFAEEFTEIVWRGNPNLMWKADYASMYLNKFNMEWVNQRKYKYLSDDNMDAMFLLRK